MPRTPQRRTPPPSAPSKAADRTPAAAHPAPTIDLEAIAKQARAVRRRMIWAQLGPAVRETPALRAVVHRMIDDADAASRKRAKLAKRQTDP